MRPDILLLNETYDVIGWRGGGVLWLRNRTNGEVIEVRATVDLATCCPHVTLLTAAIPRSGEGRAAAR